ncbi:MAG TPA: YceI family protein [Gammaproteobacteria bacterium]|nr:YceI family protein [Gammaproteobacteria bacterium]
MKSRLLLPAVLAFAGAALTCTAVAAPVTYTADPNHTHPAFEVDHMGGVSVWRGFFKKATGTIVLDKAAGTGTVDMDIDLNSAVMPNDALTAELPGDKFFQANKYPTAHYHGTLGGFVNGAPTTVTGELNLHGVTKPVNLKILSFKCIMHPFYKVEDCGADATGTFNRDDFGIDGGKAYGFNMGVTLRIQVEALAPK